MLHGSMAKRAGLAAFALVVLGLGATALWSAVPQSSGQEEGARLFEELCSACHTVGQGGENGPDLAGITSRRDREWLIRFIVDPEGMIAEKDATALKLLQEWEVPMPDLDVTRQQAELLVAYLEVAATARTAKPRESEGLELPAGNPDVGRELFLGTRPFARGGLPCTACHGVAGSDALGGTLGKDLTAWGAPSRVRGLAAALRTMPFPTMKPVYANQPLTEEETAHLLAFLQQAQAFTAKPQGWPVLLAGVGGVVLLLLPGVVLRSRFTRVRKPLPWGGKP